MATFHKAEKHQGRLRLGLIGPSGSGKTYTALLVASGLVESGERIALVDTERGSASKYADEFDFDVLELSSFHPQQYIDAIHAAVEARYAVLILDSLSHAWMGKEGALELVDRAAKRSPSGNKFAAWRDVTPLHNALVDAMLQADCHIIATMRAKTEYVIETTPQGKQAPRKVGMAPVQRDGIEFEFDVVGDMTLDNDLVISKTRCRQLGGAVLTKPNRDLGTLLKTWLSDGAPAVLTKQVEINGQTYTTKGIDRDALLELWNLRTTLDKRAGEGAAKKLLHKVTGKESSVELTADEGTALLRALRKAVREAGEKNEKNGRRGKKKASDAADEHAPTA